MWRAPIRRPCLHIGSQPQPERTRPRDVGCRDMMPPVRVGIDNRLYTSKSPDLVGTIATPLRDKRSGDSPLHPVLWFGPFEVEEDRTSSHLGEPVNPVHEQLRLNSRISSRMPILRR